MAAIMNISRLEEELLLAKHLAKTAENIGDINTANECYEDIEKLTTEIEMIVFANVRAS